MNRRAVSIIGCAIALWLPCAAQNTLESLPLKGRHAITLGGGMKMNSQTAVSVSPAEIDLKSGFVGALTYGYWYDSDWQVNLSVGAFGAGTQVSFRGVSTGAIAHIQVGMSYYPSQLALGAVGRPYISLAAGAYTGSATQAGFIGAGAVQETVPGGRASVGIDFFPTSWMKLGPAFSYHFLGDFTKIVGDRRNFTGTEFSLGFGVVL